jgi:hypothetical protein
MIEIPSTLASPMARYLVFRITTILQSSIKKRLEALSPGDLLALSFEVSQHVRRQVRQNSDPNHTPSFYMIRVTSHPLYQLIDKELLRRDLEDYEKWDPGPGLNQAQILYKIQKKSRKYAEDR